MYARVVYDRVRKRKYYFEIPAFLQIERGKSRAGNSKSNENKNKNVFVFIFIFIWCFEFSRSWFSSFNMKKARNFKMIFPFPYPIIYNPSYILCGIVVFWSNEFSGFGFFHSFIQSSAGMCQNTKILQSNTVRNSILIKYSYRVDLTIILLLYYLVWCSICIMP